MSSIIKLFLLLAAMVCISKAQLNEATQHCLCQRFRNQIRSKSEIKDIQIYPATSFCSKVEIVVTVNSGLRFCLNPATPAVKKLLTRIMKQKTSPTSTSSPDITQTAHF